MGSDLFGEFPALLFGAHVAPDQGGTNYFVRRIQHDRTVHLPGKPYASDLLGGQGCAGQRFPHCDPAGPPPVFGMLLRPTNLRRSKWLVFLGSRCEDLTSLADDDGASAAGTNVNSKNTALHTGQFRCAQNASGSGLAILVARTRKKVRQIDKIWCESTKKLRRRILTAPIGTAIAAGSVYPTRVSEESEPYFPSLTISSKASRSDRVR